MSHAPTSSSTASSADPALIAQPRALKTLERLLDDARAHALLLTGAPGSGPAAAARRIAERVLCPNGGDDGCGVCTRVARHVHPDLIWVRPEGNTIAMDQIREVIETVSRTPFEGHAQVVVIEQAETLSDGAGQAGNTLLKVLEEPIGRVVFVLLVGNAANVLPTIRSRAIEVAFPPISDPLMIAALRADGIDEGKLAAATGMDLNTVVRAARGDLMRARSIASGELAAQRRNDMFVLMHQVANDGSAPSMLANRIMQRAETAGDIATREATAEFEAMIELMSDAEKRTFTSKSNEQGQEKRTRRRARKARVMELRACLDDLASWWRDVLALNVGASEAVANLDRIEQTQRTASGPGGVRAVAAIDALDEAAARLYLNNADELVTVGAVAAELAALAAGRIRARRTLGAPSRTQQGYELALG
ncbi:MAG: hypothetical protein ABI200_02420 [Gaiellales bacterium]